MVMLQHLSRIFTKISLAAGGMVIAFLLFYCAGCLLLPVPHYRHHLYEINGQVCDAETRSPIPNARIHVNAGRYEQTTITDGKGIFTSRGTIGWHLIFWIATPSSGSLLPTHVDVSDGFLHTLIIDAEGYTSRRWLIMPTCDTSSRVFFLKTKTSADTVLDFDKPEDDLSIPWY
ncbi:MAG: hypothetical protein IKR48_09325 [Kiritimatiellae bacterium]|nr:hypothetical protein [Kiritimatiellia bacterium]